MLLTASRSRALVCAMLLLSCGNTRSSPDTSAADSGEPPDVGTSGAGGGNAGGGAGASVAPSGGTSTAGTSTAGTSSGGSNAGATGGGSSSCLSPGLVKLSYASTAACSDQGRFSAVEANGCCSSNVPAVADISITIDGSLYSGDLPACGELSPLDGLELALTVEQARQVADADGLIRTVLDCARTDVTPRCGAMLSVTALHERLALNVGDSFELKQKTVVHPSGDDISSTLVLSDPLGKLLFVSAVGARSPFIDADILPGLSLSFHSAAICSWQNEAALQRIHLKSGGDDCVVDSNTQRCCSVQGQQLEVQVPAATFFKGREPERLTNLTLRAPGLFVAVK